MGNWLMAQVKTDAILAAIPCPPTRMRRLPRGPLAILWRRPDDHLLVLVTSGSIDYRHTARFRCGCCNPPVQYRRLTHHCATIEDAQQAVGQWDNHKATEAGI